MTDEDLQKFADQNVKLTYGGKTLVGKLIAGFAAQVAVEAPYAVRWYDVNPSLGTKEERLVAIPHAAAVDSIHLVNEEPRDEIIDAADDAQTPG
jgi:hypothetical protein